MFVSITARRQRQQQNAYAVLIPAFALLWTLDVVTTIADLLFGWHEGNPGFLVLVALLGPLGALVVKFVWGLVLIGYSLVAYRYLPRATCWTLAVMCGGMLGIVLANMAHLVASFLLATR